VQSALLFQKMKYGNSLAKSAGACSTEPVRDNRTSLELYSTPAPSRSRAECSEPQMTHEQIIALKRAFPIHFRFLGKVSQVVAQKALIF
jgi:hypothetical protein